MDGHTVAKRFRRAASVACALGSLLVLADDVDEVGNAWASNDFGTTSGI